jgi:dTDP-4-dehydrorhamnose reductase
MKVLVFGKGGQVALELQKASAVVALDRTQADLTDPGACASIVTASDADVVINAAAYTAVDLAESDAATAKAINCDAPAAMARAAAATCKPFVHISTDYVFGLPGDRPWCEDDAKAPLNVYGQTKLMGEKSIQEVDGIYAILRTSWVFSAAGKNFVRSMLKLAADHNRISIVDDQFGGPTPARDLSKACLSVASQLFNGIGRSGAYHYAGLPDTNWAEFAREIFRQLDLPVVVDGIPSSAFATAARRPMNSRLDCSRIKDVFGIDRPDWRVALVEMLKELKVK